MLLTHKEKILAFVEDGRVFGYPEIREHIKIWHIAKILYKMNKQGLLERVTHGHYKITGTGQRYLDFARGQEVIRCSI